MGYPDAVGLRVGINAIFMTPNRGGMATWTLEHIAALRSVAPGIEPVVYVTPSAREFLRLGFDWAQDVEIHAVPSLGRFRAPSRLVAEVSALPALARRHRVDVLHSVANMGPIRAPMPHVMTIHDLLYLDFPSMHPGLAGRAMATVLPRSAARARFVVTPSVASRDAVVRRLGVEEGRMRVVPMGPGLSATPDPHWQPRTALGLGSRRVVLTVGAGFEHKNVGRLVEAFARVGPQRDAVLVHVGPLIRSGLTWVERAKELGVESDVRFTGFISDERLASLFDAAEILIHPAISEGFGMLPLEAMTRGVPVATSRAPALREVAGDAAEYFDALDVNEMADAIARLLDDGDRRAALVRSGYERVTAFSWERTARDYVKIYERSAREGR